MEEYKAREARGENNEPDEQSHQPRKASADVLQRRRMVKPSNKWKKRNTMRVPSAGIPNAYAPTPLATRPVNSVAPSAGSNVFASTKPAPIKFQTQATPTPAKKEESPLKPLRPGAVDNEIIPIDDKTKKALEFCLLIEKESKINALSNHSDLMLRFHSSMSFDEKKEKDAPVRECAPTNSKPSFSFGGSKAASAPATGGLFGSTPAPAPATGGLFGSTPAPAAGGLFGSTPVPAPATGGLFGSTPAPAAGGLFGSTPAPDPAAAEESSTLKFSFGGSNAASAPAASSTPTFSFGGSAPAPAAAEESSTLNFSFGGSAAPAPAAKFAGFSFNPSKAESHF